MNIDDLVRDAVRRQEMLAVDPEHVRAALPVRTTHRRRGRTVLVMATAAAAIAAVTVPAVLQDPPVASPPAAAALAGLTTVPLRYEPTWLPGGMAERERAALLPTSSLDMEAQHRTWTKSALPDDLKTPDPFVTLTVTRADHDPREHLLAAGQHPVDINVRPGWSDSHTVAWTITDDTMLLVTSPELAPLPDADLLRIARSVRPDHDRLRAALRLDWLPAGFEAQRLDQRGNSPAEWQSRIDVPNGHRALSVQIGTRVTRQPGERLTVNGHPATLSIGDDTDSDDGTGDVVSPNTVVDVTLTVDLENGTYLTVRATHLSNTTETVSRADVIKIAENTVVDPHPYLDWLGR